ncbi:phage tail assembly chaperone [Pseudoalteromonas sp. SMS1]|uniref:phage tail assembly chaperone n=1 Tax=Pseudoalteromonas sp. SMS1 TaxID=2908894 RepID=UPI001F194D58|nr:phage tail assembly chaperone [Pseudoalteromonas sp. SMS1]MCF2856456.1 phage tail assembly chaperone [Pseudoalteromonas sp. SMS1]
MENNVVTEPHGEDISWVTVRSQRDNLLAESDLLVLRALETSQMVPTALVEYRQALRDLPNSFASPEEVTWPQLAE